MHTRTDVVNQLCDRNGAEVVRLGKAAMSSLLPVSYVGSSTAVSSCAFDEEFVDFEAHQYSVVSDEWAISELDVEALGITKEATETAGMSNSG